MYKWFLAWRYLHTKLIAFFGIASVTLCVAMVLVVMSVMGGFLDTIRERSRGLHSEIVLESGTLQGFPFYEEFQQYLTDHNADIVSLSTPVIYTYGIFRVPATTYTKPARVVGMRLKEYTQVNDFKKGLHYEHYFPGTTNLKPQRMPLGGMDDKQHLVLPPDLEAANAHWRESESNAKKKEKFIAHPYEMAMYPPYVTINHPGDRVYAFGDEGPGYVGAENDGIIIGCDLLNDRRDDGDFNRHLARGADIALTLMPISPAGNVTGEPPVRLPLRYADDSRTGIFEIDNLCVYVDLDMLQHKLAMDPQSLTGGGMTKARVNQLLVSLRPGTDLETGKAVVTAAWEKFIDSLGELPSMADERALSFVDVMTWEDLQRPFIQAVEKEKVLVTLLFSLISLVAMALVGCVFYMIVEKKTRDIGILKAIGASAKGVASLFVAYALAVGLCGAILGTLVGVVFVWNINDIQAFLATLNPQLRVWSPEVYSFDKIPEIVKTWDALGVGFVAVLASVAGSIIPAAIAGLIWPVKALRYE